MKGYFRDRLEKKNDVEALHMNHGFRAGKGQCGYSLVEMIVTFAIISVVAAIGVPAYSKWLPTNRVNGAGRLILTEFQSAKMRAVSENNDYVITFNVGGHSFSIYDDNDNDFYTAGAESGELIRTVDIDDKYQGIKFGYVAGETAPAGGAISSAVTFTGSPPRFRFRPTGLSDKSGSVYLKPDVDTARRNRQRAVTVITTGRVRLYTHTGSTWE